jgi:predicted enzyme related to lactoylglutathione lyase
MGRLVHFEIPAADPNRAVEFYKKVFGWKIEKWPGLMDYWLVMTGAEGTPGINGGVLKKDGGPLKATTNTVDVESVDNAIAAISGAGGKAVVPKMPIPGVGYLAYCEDTEGNLFGIMQADKNAK